jgi:hypothetical protein
MTREEILNLITEKFEGKEFTLDIREEIKGLMLDLLKADGRVYMTIENDNLVMKMPKEMLVMFGGY